MIDINAIKAAYLKRSEEMLAKEKEVQRRIVLYASGQASRSVSEEHIHNVIFNIPIPEFYYNSKSRLLFCYDSGNVNAMVIQYLLDEKIRSKTRFSKHGFNADCSRTLVRVFVCRYDDFIVVFSKDEDGKRYIKAKPIGGGVTRYSMNAQGRLLVEGARPYRWMVVPRELKAAVAPIRTGRSAHPGVLLEDYPFYKKLLELDSYADTLTPRPIVKL